MSFTTKQWKDRISEYPTRRTLTDTTSSAVSTVTVAREEGTISQEGDAFSATNMNDLETRISNGFSTLSNDSVVLSSKNTTTNSIKFGKDSSNKYGYIIPGADTVTPFSSSVGTYKVTLTSTLADISTISATIVSDGVTYTGSASGNNTSPGSHKIAVGDVTFILSAWYSGTSFTAENTGKFIISNPKGTFELIAFKTPTGKFVIGDN